MAEASSVRIGMAVDDQDALHGAAGCGVIARGTLRQIKQCIGAPVALISLSRINMLWVEAGIEAQGHVVRWRWRPV